MYYVPYMYQYPHPHPHPHPYYVNPLIDNQRRQSAYWPMPNEMKHGNRFASPQPLKGKGSFVLKDYGTQPFVVNIDKATNQNNTFRTALWTGKNLQVTLMSIGVGKDIGLEVHPTVDQFLRIEEGQGMVQAGNTKDNLYFEERVHEDYAIMIPAGTWHNVINTGNKPMKLYSIYAPPEHPFGTVHKTKADALAAEKKHTNK
ncbi:cupin domain-containing protein [Pseudobacillus sp. 179-B 2D1 NHS]|uniref:cupin domain-containing protein n=1 Tax=Pseudobacillus sp. 179-B 2D1 NHS TaxID=3374292 RepID=UPI003879D03C